MTRRYYNYSKAQFERGLLLIKNKVKFPYFYEVTDRLIQEGNDIHECVYVIKTHQADVSILIYSSISKNNARARTIGSDAVRVVVVKYNSIEKKNYYFSEKKHLRIDTLFENLEKTISSVISRIKFRQYDYSTFTKGIGI